LHTLRENNTLLCEKSPGKGPYFPGRGFAVRSRTTTIARQTIRQQRHHCRVRREFCMTKTYDMCESVVEGVMVQK
jgi:hypothetical protein